MLISEALDKKLFKPVHYLVNNAMKTVKDRFNPEIQNGAFLLGVNGPVTIAHGSSTPLAIKNAILYTSNNLNDTFI